MQHGTIESQHLQKLSRRYLEDLADPQVLELRRAMGAERSWRIISIGLRDRAYRI
jgi:hypothetical protein